jgi:hypothetical protein
LNDCAPKCASNGADKHLCRSDRRTFMSDTELEETSSTMTKSRFAIMLRSQKDWLGLMWHKLIPKTISSSH